MDINTLADKVALLPGIEQDPTFMCPLSNSLSDEADIKDCERSDAKIMYAQVVLALLQ